MDQRLENDTLFIKDLSLCQLRLMKDGDLDWFVLVPKRKGIVEWTDLSLSEQTQLCQEIDFVSKTVLREGRGDKLNIATLGNVVSQFHLHIVYRKKDDRAWPAPIWGSNNIKPFEMSKADSWKAIFAELSQN